VDATRGWRRLALAALATAALGGGTARAQEGLDYSPEEIAFIAADTDGDGVISEAEFVRDAARGFATLDQDGSGTLTPEELGPHDPAQFRRVDADGDGVLTFEEVMTHKMRAFKAGDTNQDGGLSFDEMVSVVEQELGVAP
jgi:Ca2+-binding EF-hand superfamily protein